MTNNKCICGKEIVWNGLCQTCADRQVEIMSIKDEAEYFTVDKAGTTMFYTGKRLKELLKEGLLFSYEEVENRRPF